MIKVLHWKKHLIEGSIRLRGILGHILFGAFIEYVP